MVYNLAFKASYVKFVYWVSLKLNDSAETPCILGEHWFCELTRGREGEDE